MRATRNTVSRNWQPRTIVRQNNSARLPDYRPFADFARTTHEGIFRQLQMQKLGETKREVVYSFGAAEGLLLDQIKPGWRRRYFVQKFDLGKL